MKRLQRDDVLYVTEKSVPHPIAGYSKAHEEYSVIDLRGYRKGYEPRLEIQGIYTPNSKDTFRLQDGHLPPYQPTTTGDQLVTEMRRRGIHKAFRIAPVYSTTGNPQEFITISFKGDTTFKLGEIVSEQLFTDENERVRKLGLRPAKGWSKSKGVLKSWGDGEKTLEDTKGGTPGYTYPRSAIPEPYQREVRRELRKIPTWKLQEAYEKLKGGESTGVELMERNRAYALSAIEEILYERGKIEGGNPGASEKPSYLKQDSEIYDRPFALRLQAEMMKEMRQPFRELLTPGKFPKRDEALKKLGKFTIAEVHADGDLTVRSADKLYIVTTNGKTFEMRQPTVIPEPTEKQSRPGL